MQRIPLIPLALSLTALAGGCTLSSSDSSAMDRRPQAGRPGDGYPSYRFDGKD